MSTVLWQHAQAVWTEVNFSQHLNFTNPHVLRAGVCRYRPEVGKIKFLKNPQKIMYTPLGILVMKI